MSYNSTHTGAEIDDAISKVKNGVPISNGGTGATTAKQARKNLGLDSLSVYGVTATATELNYCDGVTNNIQTQLNKKIEYNESPIVAGEIVPFNIAQGGTGATTAAGAITNLGIADYIVEEYVYNSTWYVTKWANGRAEARMIYFASTGTLTMTAIGNIYYSNNLFWDLPTGLFIDNTYYVSHEIRSAGGPISFVRQTSATKDTYACRVQKSNNTTTSVDVKFKIEGRWK